MTALSVDKAIDLAKVHGTVISNNVVAALQTAYAAGFSDAGVERDVMSQADLDQHLDQVLRAAGSGLRYYTMEKSKEDMRAAMRKFADAVAGVLA